MSLIVKLRSFPRRMLKRGRDNRRRGVSREVEAQQERTIQVFRRIEAAFPLALVFEVVEPGASGVDEFGVVGEVKAGKIGIGLNARHSRLSRYLPPDRIVRVRRAVIIAKGNQ